MYRNKIVYLGDTRVSWKLDMNLWNGRDGFRVSIVLLDLSCPISVNSINFTECICWLAVLIKLYLVIKENLYYTSKCCGWINKYFINDNFSDILCWCHFTHHWKWRNVISSECAYNIIVCFYFLSRITIGGGGHSLYREDLQSMCLHIQYSTL